MMDVSRATFAKVTVKKTPPQPGSTRPKLQIVRPTPERKEVQPVVKQGSELKPTFQYCPYQYYGRLAPFKEVMCQSYWHIWHRKVWQTGKIHDNVLQLYNNAITKGADYGIVYTYEKKRDMRLMLAGFKQMSSSQLKEMLDVYAGLSSTTISNADLLGGIKSALAPCVIQAFDDLTQLLTTTDFSDKVWIWRESCSIFNQMVREFEEHLGDRTLGVLKELISQIGSLDSERKIVLWALLIDRQYELITEIRSLVSIIASKILALGIQDVDPFRTPPELLAATTIIVAEQVLFAIMSCQECDRMAVLTHYRNRLREVAAVPPDPRIFGLAFNGLRHELTSVVQLNLYGWDLIDYSKPVSTSIGRTEIDIIATKNVPGVGKVASFVEVKAGSLFLIGMPDAQAAANQLTRYLNYVLQVQQYCALGNACEVGADMRVVAFIFHGISISNTAEWLANTAASVSSGIPVIVIYCISNCGTANARYAIAHNPHVSVTQAQAICAAMGYCITPALPPPLNAVVVDPVPPLKSPPSLCRRQPCLEIQGIGTLQDQ